MSVMNPELDHYLTFEFDLALSVASNATGIRFKDEATPRRRWVASDTTATGYNPASDYPFIERLDELVASHAAGEGEVVRIVRKAGFLTVAHARMVIEKHRIGGP